MKTPPKSEWRKRSGRLVLLALGMLSLICGVWGGLVRLPLNLPLPGGNANWITFHGPLMVCGFLGTVIGLERAVGLPGVWPYLAPLLTGAGAGLLGAGFLGKPPVALITLGSFVFWAVTLKVVRLQPVAFTKIMSSGGLVWVIGNILWWFGWPFYRVVPWWIAFLALTILGERLDLSRFQKPSRWSRPILWVSVAILAVGLVLSTFNQVAGERTLGAALIALTIWLGRFDVARRALAQSGLPRFMSTGLLIGFGWLGLAGVLMVLFSPLVSGLRYDSVLHAFFVGFVFSMIFAHAPVIFPAVLVVQPIFTPRFYSHLVLLQVALALRVGGDLANSNSVRQWGAVLSGIAILLFILNTISAIVLRPGARPSTRSGLPSAS